MAAPPPLATNGSPTESRKKTAEEVVIEGTREGLGIRIVGGRNIASEQRSDFGIFVKEVIKDRLADLDGRLRRGDQLLEANGTSLIGVSNDRAVDVLKACAMTDRIVLLVTRDATAQSDFRRLSTSLITSQTPLPKATSTPYPPPTGSKDYTIRDSAVSYASGMVTITDTTSRSSTSSELTQISTTDISSHGDDLDEQPLPEIGNLNLNSNMNNAAEFSSVAVQPRSQKTLGASANTSIAQLSDIDVTVPNPPFGVKDKVSSPLGVGMEDSKQRLQSASSEEGVPPPLPISAPPPLDDSHIQPNKMEPISPEIAVATGVSSISGRRTTSHEGKASVIPVAVSPPIPVVHNIAIPKTAGLGIIIAGGVNRQDGPHIYVDKILEGMDAARDGRLKKGDKILTVNGEDFSNIPRQRALTILTQLKIRPTVKAYTLTIERSSVVEAESNSGLPSLPEPARTTIFDSDTLTVSEAEFSESDHKTQAPPLDVPEVYYTQSSNARLTGHPLAGASHSTEDPAVPFSTPPRYATKKELGKTDSLHKRMSMDPNARVKLSKLEWALSYMGHRMSPQQQGKIRTTLDIDDNGKVLFADFVRLAREMFPFQLDVITLQANFVQALIEKESVDLPDFPRKATSADELMKGYSSGSSGLKLSSSQPVIPQPIPYDSELSVSAEEVKLHKMRQQLHDLGNRRDQEKLSESLLEQELEELKLQLKQKDAELQRLRQVPSAGPGDSHVLRKKLSLTEAAMRASMAKEHIMEDTLRGMEEELSALRDQTNENLTIDEQRRRLAAVSCELRKEKARSRRFAVATERLLKFIEECHDALVKTPEADRIIYHPHGKGEAVQRGDAVTGNPRPPQYLSRRAKVTSNTLAEEAKETVAAVWKMLEVDELPFGWEEAHTNDGVKYFVNHETQTTSWVHPITKVNPNVHSRPSTAGDRASSQASVDNVPHPIQQHA